MFSCKTKESKTDYLGVVELEISGIEAAQPHFEKGLLLLHSFEFEDSREAFLKADMDKAIRLTAKLIGRRLGDKLYVSPYIASFEKMGQGEHFGMHCTTDSGKQIRFNWKMSDTSGAISSIDVWYKKKYKNTTFI